MTFARGSCPGTAGIRPFAPDQRLARTLLKSYPSGGNRMAARLSVEAESYLAAFFTREILPVLTPITLDQGHPLPAPREESFHLAIRFRPKPGRRAHFGVVLVHSMLEPFVR